MRPIEPLCCPNCGSDVGVDELIRSAAEASQRRIAELEAQVKILSDKATAAADKLADYEDELHSLRRKQSISPSNLLATPPATAVATSPTRGLSSFLSITTRRGAGPPSPPIDPSDPNSRPSSSSGGPSTAELEKALEAERNLRKQAESRLQQVTNELEDLSATLFQQANEMVAEERRARSKLEERVAMLEKREKEKVARLGQLEQAVGRINRVKGLLLHEEEANSGGDSGRGSVSSEPGTEGLRLPS
ncbi:hypothetical protein BDZ91DRAFT_650748 [Kalaharituber pfeilii]|nr:hypothetical protein BDZ91DRAFT_650748 [Kalaharituber pfeilii]